MGLFDFLKKKEPVVDINATLSNKEPGAVIMDVRDMLYFGKGHVPEAISLPMLIVDSWRDVLPADKNVPIYVYGKDDEEATRAAGYLTDKHFLAYTNVKNMGGFGAYTGEIEEGLKPKKVIPF